jgi:hypothetical protein
MRSLDWEKSDVGLKSGTCFAVVYADEASWAVYYHASALWPDRGEATSLEAAKEAAEAHYRERLMEALEPVDAMTYRDIGAVRQDLEKWKGQ